MPNYYTITRNPIARAGIIRKLMAKGYSLPHNGNHQFTVGDFFSKWPAHQWPIVIVRMDGSFASRPTIDLSNNQADVMAVDKNSIRVSPAQISTAIPHMSMAVMTQVPADAVRPAPVFPEAAKYKITYQKADGSVGDYTVSNPIEMQPDRFTTYAFGKGIKTFIKARVRDFAKVA